GSATNGDDVKRLVGSFAHLHLLLSRFFVAPARPAARINEISIPYVRQYGTYIPSERSRAASIASQRRRGASPPRRRRWPWPAPWWPTASGSRRNRPPPPRTRPWRPQPAAKRRCR